MKKTVVIYSNKHAESIASAAKILVSNPEAIAIEVSDTERLSKELKGTGNIVHRMVDEIDERYFKGDKVHYVAKSKKKGIRRVVEVYEKEEIPYIINVIADHIHNQEPDIYKTGIIAEYSDLSDNHVLAGWKRLLKDDLDEINSLKATGVPIVKYLKVVESKKKTDKNPAIKKAKKKKKKTNKK